MQSNEKEPNNKTESRDVGLWIKKGIRESELQDAEKLLLSIISAYCNYTASVPCHALNTHFEAQFNWNLRKVVRTITDLKAGGWINLTGAGSPFRKIYLTNKSVELIEQRYDATKHNDESVVVKTKYDKNVAVTTTKMSHYNDKSVALTTTKVSHIYNTESIVDNNENILSLFPTGQIAAVPEKEVKKKREVIDDLQFLKCFQDFNSYGTRKKAFEYWKKLSAEQRNEIEKAIPAYVASTPGCKYRKYFEGWINPTNELWKRPVANHSNATTKTGEVKAGQTMANGFTRMKFG